MQHAPLPTPSDSRALVVTDHPDNVPTKAKRSERITMVLETFREQLYLKLLTNRITEKAMKVIEEVLDGDDAELKVELLKQMVFKQMPTAVEKQAPVQQEVKQVVAIQIKGGLNRRVTK